MIARPWLGHLILILTGIGFLFIAFQIYDQGYASANSGRAIYTREDASPTFWLDVAGHLVFGLGGTVAGLLGLLRNLRERCARGPIINTNDGSTSSPT